MFGLKRELLLKFCIMLVIFRFHIFLSPCIKSGLVSVQIAEVYLAGLEECKNRLHGKMLLFKGDKSMNHLHLCKKLDIAWKNLGDWKVMPLGKGFYEFTFSSFEDIRWTLAVDSWNLSPGILRVFAWTNDFALASMKLTKPQCWIRIHGLPFEYMQPKAIFSIARVVRSPRSLDDCTTNKTKGFYARVLVDVDMAFDLPNQILVERPRFSFVAYIQCEKLSSFCSVCKLIRHSIFNCRRKTSSKPKRKGRWENHSMWGLKIGKLSCLRKTLSREQDAARLFL